MKTILITLLLALLTFGPLALGGEISDLFNKGVRGNPKSRGEQLVAATSKSRSITEIESANHCITEIGIERSGLVGSFPKYTFVIKSDGTFRYKGTANVEHIGEFKGRISDWDFQRLAQFIRDAGYMELDDEYFVPVLDSRTTFTTVVMSGKRKVISDYSVAGPTKLWAIEQLIEDLAKEADGIISQNQKTKKSRLL